MSSSIHKAKRCVIVGAGVAGISAAIHCTQLGLHVVVLESRAYIGGRAHSFVDTATADVIDNGQHLFMGCYESFLSVLRTLGSDSALTIQPSLKVVFREQGARIDVFASKFFNGTLGAAEALFRMKYLGFSSKYRASLMMIALKMGAKSTSQESALDFLHRHHQTQEMISRFWEPLIFATMNAKPADTSAALFVEVMTRSILAGAANSALIIPRVGLTELLRPFSGWMKDNGGELELGCEVHEILTTNGKVLGVGTKDQREIRADYTILAVPPRAMQRIQGTEGILSAKQAEIIGHSTIISVYLWFDQDFMVEDFCAALGMHIQWIFNRRRISSSTPLVQQTFPGHIAITISAAHHLSERKASSIVELCLDELRVLFPRFGSTRLLHSKVIKERFATHDASQKAENVRPDCLTSLTNLFLAGDWTNTGLPATLEGAAQSGILAAESVLMSSRNTR